MGRVFTRRAVARSAVAPHGARLISSRVSTPSIRQGVRSCRSGVSRRARAFSTLPGHRVEGMPALSPTMEEGNIAEWSVQEGQEINPGDALAQIETDKATVDFEATDGGYVAKIL